MMVEVKSKKFIAPKLQLTRRHGGHGDGATTGEQALDSLDFESACRDARYILQQTT